MRLWWERTRRRTRIHSSVLRAGLSAVLVLLLAAPLGGGPAPVAGDFVDATPGSGIDFRHVAFQTPKRYMLEIMGSGVALLDYDNDGLLDIFLVNGAPITDPTPLGTVPRKTSPEHWHRLYRQTAVGKFEDVTEKAGVQGV